MHVISLSPFSFSNFVIIPTPPPRPGLFPPHNFHPPEMKALCSLVCVALQLALSGRTGAGKGWIPAVSAPAQQHAVIFPFQKSQRVREQNLNLQPNGSRGPTGPVEHLSSPHTSCVTAVNVLAC